MTKYVILTFTIIKMRRPNLIIDFRLIIIQINNPVSGRALPFPFSSAKVSIKYSYIRIWINNKKISLRVKIAPLIYSISTKNDQLYISGQYLNCMNRVFFYPRWQVFGDNNPKGSWAIYKGPESQSNRRFIYSNNIDNRVIIISVYKDIIYQ